VPLFLVHPAKMDDIKKCIVNEYTYDRMKNMSEYPWDSYTEFYDWNVKCLQESQDDAIWLYSFCKLLATDRIKLMDEESCAIFAAYGFYYDEDKNIVLVNPR
jgi:hypothetical protein